jgi:hypothetical protein
VGLVVLALVGVAIGALISLAQRGNSGAGVGQELAALKESSERRSESAGSRKDAADEPRLCRELRRAQTGKVRDASLEELSGIVQSRRDGKLLWGIEDSGNPAQLAAFRTNGAAAGLWNVAGAENFDWEDIATGPGAPGGAAWLYAADIGDNLGQRDDVTIYRVPEPGAPSGGGTTAPAQALELEYPDGAHDAESFLVDPRRGTLIVITKGVPGAVYAASKPKSWSGTVRLRKVADAGVAYATAADVSADGRTVAVRGYFSVALWQRRGSEPLTSTLRRAPCTSPTGLDDGQGEAIALAANGRSAWIVAEGNEPPIRRLTPR